MTEEIAYNVIPMCVIRTALKGNFGFVSKNDGVGHMNNLISYLESKDAIFHGAMVLIVLYVPHAGNLFMQLEHLDMTFSGFTFLNWIYGVCLAGAIEFLILVFIINGYRATGKFYAVVSFFLNVFYYNYWFTALRNPSDENIKATIISLFICLTHSLAVWQLSELFFKRLLEDRENLVEHWCPECDAGPFVNKRALEGHRSRAHKGKNKSIAGASSSASGTGAAQ